MQPDANVHGHVIVCGVGHVGYRIIELLREFREPFTVVTREIRPEWRLSIQENSLRFIQGDARSIKNLRDAGIETARALFIVTSDDLVNIEIAIDAQKLNPKCALIVRIFDRYLADRIGREVHVRSVLSPALLTAPVFVAAALGEEMMRVFDVGANHLNIIRVTLPTAPSEPDATVEALCARYGVIPLAVEVRPASPAPTVEVSKLTLANVCAIVVAASARGTEQLSRSGYLPQYSAIHTASHSVLKRFKTLLSHPLYPISTLRRTWKRTPRLLRTAFVSLLSLVGISVVVFHENMPDHPTWVDTFYFVVTLMTTIGFGDFNLRHADAWLKLFGCGVMIGAAGLVTITFGIVTNYIVSERVAEALGHRQSGLKDHVVVIGLGDVGTRVAEKLFRIQEPVIAIERAADQETVAVLQDNIHVIIGDANRESTLQLANIKEARAVIVTTTSDVDSLRIAHQAEMLNAKLRAVIRIYDSSLARKLGAGFGIEQTVNAPEIAAATFMACCVKPDVEQGFMLGRRLMLLRWLSDEEMQEHAAVGRTIDELRKQGVTIVLRRCADGSMPPSGHGRVGSGDRLLVLEEYFPESHSTGAPKIAALSSQDRDAPHSEHFTGPARHMPPSPSMR